MGDPALGYLIILLAVAATALLLLVFAVLVIHRAARSNGDVPRRARRAAQGSILIGVFALGFATALAVYDDFNLGLTLVAIGSIAMGGIMLRDQPRERARQALHR